MPAHRKRTRRRRCLSPACGAPAHCRGLCRPCYEAAARRVAAGRETWPALVAAGLALPDGRLTPFSQAAEKTTRSPKRAKKPAQ